MNLEKIKSLSKLSISQVINAGLGVIRSKVNALLLGTLGVGVMTQMNTLQNSVVGYLDLGMSNGIIKYSASAVSENNYDSLKKILATFQVLFGGLSLLMMIACILLLNNLAIWFFSDISYWYAVIFVIIAIPFTLLKNGYRAVINGIGALTSIAIMDVLTVISGFVIVVSLVLLFQLKGAILSIPLFSITDCLITVLFLKKNLKPLNLKYNLINDFDVTVIKKLFKFAAVGLTVGTVANFANMFIAAYTVNQLGLAKIGIYNPVLAISGLYMAIVINTAMTYMFPKLSSLEKKNELINSEINSSLKIFFSALFPFMILLVGFRFIIIPLVYSNDFMESASLLIFQLIGDVLRVFTWIVGILFQSLLKLKVFAIFEISFIIMKVVSIYLLIPIFNVKGLVITHIILYFLSAVLYFFYFKKTINLRINKRNIILLFSGLIVLVLHFYIKDFGIWQYVITVLLLIIFIFFNYNKSELQTYYNLIQNRISKKNLKS